jgi:hypothetical protein
VVFNRFFVVRGPFVRLAVDQTFDVFRADLEASKRGDFDAFLWGNRHSDSCAPCMLVTTAGYMFGIGRYRAKHSPGTKEGESSCWHCAAISASG